MRPALNLVGIRSASVFRMARRDLYDCKTTGRDKTFLCPQATGKSGRDSEYGEVIAWLTEAPRTACSEPPAPLHDSASALARPTLRLSACERTPDPISIWAGADALALSTRIGLWQSGIALFAENATVCSTPATGDTSTWSRKLPAGSTRYRLRASALYLAREGRKRAAVPKNHAPGGGAAPVATFSRLPASSGAGTTTAWTSAGIFLSSATDTFGGSRRWRILAQGRLAPSRTQAACQCRAGVRGWAVYAVSCCPPVTISRPSTAQITLANRHSLDDPTATCLYHTDLDKATQKAFLPWNEKGLRVQTIRPRTEWVVVGD